MNPTPYTDEVREMEAAMQAMVQYIEILQHENQVLKQRIKALVSMLEPQASYRGQKS